MDIHIYSNNSGFVFNNNNVAGYSIDGVTRLWSNSCFMELYELGIH